MVVLDRLIDVLAMWLDEVRKRYIPVFESVTKAEDNLPKPAIVLFAGKIAQ